MTEEKKEASTIQEQPNDKEYNFRMQQAKYERLLAQERSAREEAERKAQELVARAPKADEDDEDDEPYVDRRKLKKTLDRFGAQSQQQTKAEIQQAVQSAIYEERKNNWLKNNADFYEVLKHAEKFAQKDPDLAESILEMPDTFERQKLVYKNIKALGLHKPEEPKQSIQDTINANRRSPYYQPSGVGSSPYAGAGDFSPSGQQNAYQKMKELQSKLRL